MKSETQTLDGLGGNVFILRTIKICELDDVPSPTSELVILGEATWDRCPHGGLSVQSYMHD